tara:strand:+ start:490 stop:1068 length:579 start_codon:yes stop_codon:yes gene_type:complete
MNDVENSAKITEHHKTVSNLDTPKYFIKSKGGVDYVEYSYMRDVADEYFPGWSWNIIYRELGSEAYEVHGRLKWFDNGLWREGDAVAAHRVQKKRDGSGFVDIGNDVKAANTDAIKKAFNMYLNIADDVYRNRVEDLSLNDGDIDMIMDEIKDLDNEWKSKIEGSLERGEILKPDLNRVINKIQTIKGEANE